MKPRRLNPFYNPQRVFLWLIRTSPTSTMGNYLTLMYFKPVLLCQSSPCRVPFHSAPTYFILGLTASPVTYRGIFNHYFPYLPPYAFPCIICGYQWFFNFSPNYIREDLRSRVLWRRKRNREGSEMTEYFLRFLKLCGDSNRVLLFSV